LHIPVAGEVHSDYLVSVISDENEEGSVMIAKFIFLQRVKFDVLVFSIGKCQGVVQSREMFIYLKLFREIIADVLVDIRRVVY
jgi:hypothetical protein